MKIFTNKNVLQKLIIAIVAVTLFNFCIAPTKVQAKIDGGDLFIPMKDFLTVVSDIFITIVQWGITGDWYYVVASPGEATYQNNGQNNIWPRR